MSPKSAPGIKIETDMLYGDESKYVKVIVSPRVYPDGIEVLHITDVQYGHKHCNVAKFIEYRDWILAKPNRFVFFGGDMVDAATVLSVASPYSNTKEPQAQVYDFVELAAPMRHRILGFVGGNHERRSERAFGDLGHLLATLLKTPYSSGKQFVDIHYGRQIPHRNSLWHGGSGSRTKGAKAQMLHRFMTQGDSHVYWVGHLHDCLMLTDVRERRPYPHEPQGSMVAEHYLGVMSSSFLSHYGTYAEVMGMSAGGCNMWRLIIEPSGKWEMTHRVVD
jgi:hypothetical protein